jgi:hypothetical protein
VAFPQSGSTSIESKVREKLENLEKNSQSKGAREPINNSDSDHM